MKQIHQDHRYLVPVLLLLYFVVSYFSILDKTLTYDEYDHYLYGKQISQGNADRAFDNDSKMPVSVVNSVPIILTDLFGVRGHFTDRELFTYARMMTTLAAIGLATIVYLWSRELYGPKAGLFSLTLFLLDPNLLAHARLITTDLYAALAITASCYFFWQFLKEPNVKKGFVSALVLGISQLAKYSCLLLYPTFLLILVLNRLRGAASDRPNQCSIGGPPTKTHYLLHLALFAVISVIVINLGFLMHQTGSPLKNYELRSTSLQSIAKTPVLMSTPLPLPMAYVEGLDRVKANEASGASFGNIYLLGELRSTTNGRLEGFKNYFLVCWLLKVPLPTQIFILISLFLLMRRLQKRKFLLADICLVVPPVFFLAYFSLFFNANMGIRLILMIFPFLYVLSGSLLAKNSTVLPHHGKWMGLGIVWLVVSVGSYFPHYLSYFNEILINRIAGYRYLADSNLEWGQNRIYLHDYLKKNKDAVYLPSKPTTGKIVVGANDLVGIFRPERLKWLRENFEPVDLIAYSYLVYELDEQALNRLHQQEP